MEVKRAEWDASGATTGSGAFKTSFLKGEWTMLNKGVPCDAVKGYASPKVAKDWCTKYDMPQGASFVLDFYGEAEAITLCKGWTSRMSHLYALWLAQENEEYAFTAEDVSSWQQPAELAGVQAGLSTSQSKRIMQLFTQNPTIMKKKAASSTT